MHGMELPFVFDNPDKISSMTGAGSDRAAIAPAMSSTGWHSPARQSQSLRDSSVGSVQSTTWRRCLVAARGPKMTPGAGAKGDGGRKGKQAGLTPRSHRWRYDQRAGMMSVVATGDGLPFAVIRAAASVPSIRSGKPCGDESGRHR